MILKTEKGFGGRATNKLCTCQNVQQENLIIFQNYDKFAVCYINVTKVMTNAMLAKNK